MNIYDIVTEDVIHICTPAYPHMLRERERRREREREREEERERKRERKRKRERDVTREHYPTKVKALPTRMRNKHGFRESHHLFACQANCHILDIGVICVDQAQVLHKL